MTVDCFKKKKKNASLGKYVSKIMCLCPNGRSGCLDIDQVRLCFFMETKSRLACVLTTSILFVAQNVSASNKLKGKGDVCTQAKSRSIELKKNEATEAAEHFETWRGWGGGGVIFFSAMRIPLLILS